MNTKRTTLVLAALLPIRTSRVAVVPASFLCLVTLLSAAFAAAPRPGRAGSAGYQLRQQHGGRVRRHHWRDHQRRLHQRPGSNRPQGWRWTAATTSSYVINNATVGQYNASTGATVNAAFINGQGLTDPSESALDGSNHLFVANYNNFTVGQYNASTGTTVNAAFIGGQDPIGAPSALALDGNNHLFVVEYNRVGEFNATTGATINAAFIDNRARHPLWNSVGRQ